MKSCLSQGLWDETIEMIGDGTDGADRIQQVSGETPTDRSIILDVEDRKFLRQHNFVFNVVREYKWKLEGGVING